MATRLKQNIWVDRETDPCVHFLLEDGHSVCSYSRKTAMHIDVVHVQASGFVEQMEQNERLQYQRFHGAEDGEDEEAAAYFDTAPEFHATDRAMRVGDQAARRHATASASALVAFNREHRRADRYAKWEQEAIAVTNKLLGLELDQNFDDDDGETPAAPAPAEPEEEEEDESRGQRPGRRRKRRKKQQEQDRGKHRYAKRDLQLWNHFFDKLQLPPAPPNLFPPLATLSIVPVPMAHYPMATFVWQYGMQLSSIFLKFTNLLLLGSKRVYEAHGRFYEHAWTRPMSSLVTREWMEEAHLLFTDQLNLADDASFSLVDLLARWHALIRITCPSFALVALEMLAAYALVLSLPEGGGGLIRRDGVGRDHRILPAMEDAAILGLFSIVEGRSGGSLATATPVADTRACIVEVLQQTAQARQQQQRQSQATGRIRYIVTRGCDAKFTLLRMLAVSKKMSDLTVLNHFHFNSAWLDDWFNHPSRQCWPIAVA